jgi:hypothetical protein
MNRWLFKIIECLEDSLWLLLFEYNLFFSLSQEVRDKVDYNTLENNIFQKNI